MAYTPPPNNRFAYDRDGSAIMVYGYADMRNITGNYTASQLAYLNSDIYTNGSIAVEYGPIDPQNSWICVIFPEARTVTGVYAATNNSGSYEFKYSTDTTNGVDGNWTDATSSVELHNTPIFPDARNDISAVNWSNVTGVRFFRSNYNLTGGTRTHALHLYGDRPTNIDRLAIWHPTEDREINGEDLDFGSVARTNTATLYYRVKNLSTTLTANTISLTVNANGDLSPSFVSQMTPTPGSITSLASGTISSVCQIDFNVSATASLSYMTLRIVAEAASWT